MAKENIVTMKSILLILSLLEAVSAAHRCHAMGNNCARAVTGTRHGKVPNIASRRADCSSFMEAMVIASTLYALLCS
jgi:hypothetical protein